MAREAGRAQTGPARPGGQAQARSTRRARAGEDRGQPAPDCQVMITRCGPTHSSPQTRLLGLSFPRCTVGSVPLRCPEMEQGTPRAQPRETPRLPASPTAAGRAPQSWPVLTLRRPPQPCPRAADLCLLLGLPPTPVPKRRSINAPRTERAPLPGGHWLTYPCNHVGVSPWPQGLHLHLLFPSSWLGSLPQPSARSLGSGLPAFPSRRHTALRRPAWPGPAPGAAPLWRG